MRKYVTFSSFPRQRLVSCAMGTTLSKRSGSSQRRNRAHPIPVTTLEKSGETSTVTHDEDARNDLHWTLDETVYSDTGCPFYVLAPTESTRHQLVTRLLLPALYSTELISETVVLTMRNRYTEDYKRQKIVHDVATTPPSQYSLLTNLLNSGDTNTAVVMDTKTESFQGIEQFMTFYRVRRLYPIFVSEDVDMSLSPAPDGCILVTGHLTPYMRTSLRNYGLSETKCDCIARSVETGWYYAFVARKDDVPSQIKKRSRSSRYTLSYTENGIVLLILPLPPQVRRET